MDPEENLRSNFIQRFARLEAPPCAKNLWANYKDYTKVETSSGSFQLS